MKQNPVIITMKKYEIQLSEMQELRSQTVLILMPRQSSSFEMYSYPNDFWEKSL